MHRYADGTVLRVGDLVALMGGRGTVQANLDSGEYSENFARLEWGYLENGVILETDFAGVLHIPSEQAESFVLVRRPQ